MRVGTWLSLLTAVSPSSRTVPGTQQLHNDGLYAIGKMTTALLGSKEAGGVLQEPAWVTCQGAGFPAGLSVT